MQTNKYKHLFYIILDKYTNTYYHWVNSYVNKYFGGGYVCIIRKAQTTHLDWSPAGNAGFTGGYPPLLVYTVRLRGIFDRKKLLQAM